MKTITIQLNDDGTITYNLEGELRVSEVQLVLLNTLISVIQNVLPQLPEEHKEPFLFQCYDSFNEQATAVLETILPDQQLRADLDERAILAYEAHTANTTQTIDADDTEQNTLS